MAWFKKQSFLVQVLLLLIPGVNWVTEICVRWPVYMKKGGSVRLVLCILATIPTGIAFGWIDLVWNLLFNEFFLL